jgi:hypothetical protein
MGGLSRAALSASRPSHCPTCEGEVWKGVEGVVNPFHTTTPYGVWGVVWKPEGAFQVWRLKAVSHWPALQLQ